MPLVRLPLFSSPLVSSLVKPNGVLFVLYFPNYGWEVNADGEQRLSCESLFHVSDT